MAQNTNIKSNFLRNLEKTTGNLIKSIQDYNDLRKQYDSLDLGSQFPDGDDCGNGYLGSDLKACATTFDAMKALLEANGNAHYTNLFKIVSLRI